MQAHQLTPDLFWLVLSAMAVALMWLPHIARQILQVGFWTAFWNPHHEIEPEVHWARRAKRAQRNSARHFAVFAALLIVGHLAGGHVDVLARFAEIWFVSRVGYFLTFMAGVPVAPQLLFLTNVGTSLMLGAQLLLG